jgi:DNA-binding NarL/FixJ family response regulator
MGDQRRQEIARLVHDLDVAIAAFRSLIGTVESLSFSLPTPPEVLTSRQREILQLISEGKGTKEIARQLWLSPATVRNHVSGILRALDAHSRLEAVAAARRLGLLTADTGLDRRIPTRIESRSDTRKRAGVTATLVA